jgi:hypothetical protein
VVGSTGRDGLDGLSFAGWKRRPFHVHYIGINFGSYVSLLLFITWGFITEMPSGPFTAPGLSQLLLSHGWLSSGRSWFSSGCSEELQMHETRDERSLKPASCS